MNQDLIEKKASSPMLTTLLAIAALCLIGAISMQVIEINELKLKNSTAALSAKKFSSEKTQDYNRIKDQVLTK